MAFTALHVATIVGRRERDRTRCGARHLRMARTVVLEFDSEDAARNWYESPAYQAVVGERHASAATNAVIVSGFEMPQ